jgi:TonB-linked outer membrane protein, SusC/RagA family
MKKNLLRIVLLDYSYKMYQIKDLKRLNRIMRNTIVLMFVALFPINAANVLSQNAIVNITQKNISIEELMNSVENQTGYLFLYSEKEIDIKQEVAVSKTKKPVSEVLDQAFANTDIMYSFSEDYISLRKKADHSLTVNQQAKKQITGTINDESGEPIIGANVVEKGTTNGVTTDADGKFSINVSDNAIIRISYIGYILQEVAIGSRTAYNIVIKEDTQMLEEVIVVGYGTMKKSDLTGSVVSANLEAFKESPNVNIFQSLQGSVPGVSIGQINQAGQESSIQIRGVSTLSGSTSPLIVVDGIIFNGTFADINPSDVSNVEVLKDPSSKAIYGSQAANGVILITTKTGKKGEKPTITYSGSFTSSTPTVNARLLNRDEFLQKVRDLEWRNSYTAESGYTLPNPDWNYNLSQLNSTQRLGIENGYDFDWWDAATQTARLTDHVLGVSGGSEKTSFYLSGGYTGQNGFIKNDDYSRISLRINFDTQITDWLSIGTNTSGSFTDFSGITPTIGNIANTTPLAIPWDENGDPIINPTGGAAINPLLASTNDNYSVRHRFVGNFFAVIRIPWIKGLTYRINNGYNIRYLKDFSSSIYDNGQIGTAGKINAYQFEQTLDNILNYTEQFGKHAVNATLVYGFNKSKYERTDAAGSQYSDLTLSYNNLALGAVRSIGSSAWDEASLYQMARLGYTYDSKYLITATLRRDGFSGFSRNNKFALFPSVGLGWILSEEEFLKNVSMLNFLKLRGSYGENGNKVGRYSSLARVAVGSSNYVFGDGGSTAIGRIVSSLANNDLKWEKTAGYNIGIDFGFLKNRISGNVDYYQSTTKDLLWSMVLPQTSGFNSIMSNIGELKNSGLEFLIQGTPVRTSDFSWDISVNFSRNKNKIVKLLDEEDLISSNLFIGHSIGTRYGYQVDGIWQVNDDIPNGFGPGSYRIVDLDNDGNISADNDRKILGYSEPAYQMGIQNTLKYKNFGMSFFINTIQGGKDGYMAANYPAGNNDQTIGNALMSNWFDFYDYWAPTRPDAKYANRWAASPFAETARQYQQRNFVRLQDVSLSYSVNKDLLKKIGVHNVKLYVSGKNLLTFTKWDGWDPETAQGIISDNVYPVMKSYCFGLDITF